jgi:hypothetical protein
MSTIKKLRSFLRDRSGVAAIEFAFIAPVMIAGLIVATDLSKMILDRTDMQSAARSGVQYLINGGQNLDNARNISLAAWSRKPTDGDVITERYCLCAQVVHTCHELCADDSIPESFTRVRLVGTLRGVWAQTSSQTSDEAVRVR